VLSGLPKSLGGGVCWRMAIRTGSLRLLIFSQSFEPHAELRVSCNPCMDAAGDDDTARKGSTGCGSKGRGEVTLGLAVGLQGLRRH